MKNESIDNFNNLDYDKLASEIVKLGGMLTNKKSEYLRFEQAMEYLNLSSSMLRKLIFKNNIPYYKVGKNIRFKTCDLDEWMDGNRFQANKGS